jgi:hypothetical protein
MGSGNQPVFATLVRDGRRLLHLQRRTGRGDGDARNDAATLVGDLPENAGVLLSATRLTAQEDD